MRHFLSIFLIISCFSCNPNAKDVAYTTDLSKANISRITERLQIMIDPDSGHVENRAISTDSVFGYIENRIVYDEQGKASLYYSAGSEGLIPYSLHPQKGYLPFSEIKRQFGCHIQIDKNYIVDIAPPISGRCQSDHYPDLVIDTCRSFVIILEDKIILPKNDYELLQKTKAKDSSTKHERYILYRYI